MSPKHKAGLRHPILTALAVLLLAAPGVRAQAPIPASDAEVKVWVRLKDKGPASHPLARASRAYEDLPLHGPYLAALASEGFACDTRLKWQNRVSGYIHPSRLPRLRALGFVEDIAELPRKAVHRRPRAAPWSPPFLAKTAAAAAIPDLGAFRALADTLGITQVLQWMDQEGIRPGQGVRIAVMDADFDLGHAAFDRLRQENRIKDQWDFVDGKEQAVTAGFGDSHGAQCLSLIGGSLPGKLVASAPEADFLLYRTEDSDQERYAEEDFLAAAIERAVDSGAQVISISVVYRTQFDSAQEDIPLVQMDGRTRPSSLAALGAARRNVLVVSAMGNMDGVQSGPSTLSVPSDADSILAVGMVNRAGILCGYSTTGPSADGRVKPELVSMGLIGSCSVEMAGTLTREDLDAAQGTSFAAPVVAGLAALLRQAVPGRSAQEIRQALLATARNAASPNSQIGWGLPDALKALARFRPEVSIRPVAGRLAPGPASAAGGLYDAQGRTLPTPGAVGARFRRPASLVPPAPVP